MLFEELGEPEPFPSFLPVPANVREYASKHRVGTLLTLYRSRHLLFAIIRCAVETVGLTIATGYFIKEYIDGIILDRTYPLPARRQSVWQPHASNESGIIGGESLGVHSPLRCEWNVAHQ